MGTISVSLPSDGTTADVSDYNTPLTTIVNEINGNLDNSNLATNAAIAGTKIADAAITPAKWANPYKFRGYLNSAQNTTAGNFAKLLLDAENFDTNNNLDIETNKGRYTAPVAGFYHFSASANIPASGSTNFQIALYKNGTVIAYGDQFNATAAGSIQVGVQASLQLAATDYVEVFVFCNGTVALATGSAITYFSGFLISET